MFYRGELLVVAVIRTVSDILVEFVGGHGSALDHRVNDLFERSQHQILEVWIIDELRGIFDRLRSNLVPSNVLGSIWDDCSQISHHDLSGVETPKYLGSNVGNSGILDSRNVNLRKMLEIRPRSTRAAPIALRLTTVRIRLDIVLSTNGHFEPLSTERNNSIPRSQIRATRNSS